MNELKQQIYAWAQRTVNEYKQIAEELRHTPYAKYTAFYTQSNLTLIEKEPKIAIVAINPNSICSYDDQISNAYWKVSKDIGITADSFLLGNPNFVNRYQWPLWKRLYKIFQFGKINNLLDQETDFIYTNIVHFNSRHPNDIPSNTFNKCAQRTFNLLQILQPKLILCLGKAPFQVLSKEGNTPIEEIIPGEVYRTYWKNSTIIRIPHTSKFYTNEEMQLIGKAIALIIQHSQIDVQTIRNTLTLEIQLFEKRRFKNKEAKVQDVDNSILNSLNLQYKCIDSQNNRYIYAEHLELTINPKQNFIGIRHLNRHSNYLKHEEPNESQIRIILSQYGFNTEKTLANCAWLGRKLLINNKRENPLGRLSEIKKNLLEIEKLVTKLQW